MLDKLKRACVPNGLGLSFLRPTICGNVISFKSGGLKPDATFNKVVSAVIDQEFFANNDVIRDFSVLSTVTYQSKLQRKNRTTRLVVGPA